MLRTPAHGFDVSDADPLLTRAQEEHVERALGDLLHSPPLRATAQCQHLLRYIVRHTLSGEPALLRERVIGSEVFGRPANYEPGEDPVVRIRAADLRKRLAVYYQSLAETPEVRIDIPPGSYRATFTWQDERPASSPAAESSESVVAAALQPKAEVEELRVAEPVVLAEPVSIRETPAPQSRSWRKAGWAGLALLIALGTGLYWRAMDPVRQFWAPMLADSRPVLISIGSNAVYRVGDREIDAYIAQTAKDRQAQEGMEIYPPFRPEQSLASTGLYATPDSFVATGDLAATSNLVKTLTRYGKEFEERFPNDISFAEVRDHPTILVGGANNPMARELTKNLPFVRSGRNLILDRDHPGKGWELHANPDLHDTEDYAIITRLAGKDDAAPLVSLAGLGAHGTLAATEFLCKPESVKMLRERLGPDWLKRNFQVVLRIKITDFKPVATEVIDQRMW